MSEHLSPANYNIPADLMEPQPPITPEGFHVVDRQKIESSDLRAVPDHLNPVFLQSDNAEKVVKGGEGSEFLQSQENAYAEREARRTMLNEQMASRALQQVVERPRDTTYDDLFSTEDDGTKSVEGAAVRSEKTLEELRRQEDMSVWNGNIQDFKNGKQ
jgi:hypothetical protein